MRIALLLAAALLILAAAPPSRAATGVVNTRFDSGLEWYLDKPPADAPVYAGFHGALSADGRIYRSLHLELVGSIDSYRYGAEQTRSELFVVRAGPMYVPIDFDGGSGWIAATSGWARLHGRNCLALSGGLGYMAQYGRLGIGLFSRYTQVLVPAGWGHDVKALVFGVSAGVVLLHPYRPAPVTVEVAPSDADGDGVEDAKDKCPGTDKGARVAKDGCETKPADAVVAKDPNPPEVVAPTPEQGKPSAPAANPDAIEPPAGMATGQPENDDLDEDGVPNDKDECPTTTRGLPVEVTTGCPLLRDRFALSQVTFFPLTARPKREAYAQLDELVTLLRDRPGARLRITAYVERSKDQPARVLKRVAKERARVVYELLLARGISPRRLKAIGAAKADVDEIEVAVTGSTKVVRPRAPKAAAPHPGQPTLQPPSLVTPALTPPQEPPPPPPPPPPDASPKERG